MSLQITNVSDKRRYVPELGTFVTSKDAAEIVQKKYDIVDVTTLYKLQKASEGAGNEIEMTANMVIADLMENFILDRGIEYLIEERFNQNDDSLDK